MKTILIVDDEPRIVELARDYLVGAGFAVRGAGGGEEALAIARVEKPDLIVLDLGLPDLDGLDVTRRLRRDSDIPIIMLTARGAETDKLVGLELGADDYVTKPFSPRELTARIKAVVRRTAGAPGASVRRLGAVELDPDRRTVTAGGQPIALTATEFDLLAHLAARPGRVFTREELLSSVWGYAVAAGTRTVDVHVAQVRAKLGAASPIRTVRGVGYTADE